MDESVGQIIDVPPGAVPAVNPSFVPDVLDLDYAGVREAAKKLGMVSFDEKSLLASHTLGKAMKQVGAIKIGRTILLRAADHAQEGIEQANSIIDNSTDDELKASVLTAKSAMIKAQVDAGDKFIRSAEIDASDDAENKGLGFKPFGTRQPVVVAQQAVVNATQNNYAK
jgi:hypothetical protein